ncbi:MAG: hypothetical protein U0836_19085 [Pirellulales bacterium]
MRSLPFLLVLTALGLGRVAEAVGAAPGDVVATLRDQGAAALTSDGETLIVGDLLERSGSRGGVVRRLEEPWSATPATAVLPDAADAFDASLRRRANFGVSAASFSGSTLVGDDQALVPGKTAGMAFLFGPDERLVATLTAPEPTTFEHHYGQAVAMTSDALAVGVPFWDGEQGEMYNRGIVQLYDAQGAYLRPLEPPTPHELSAFGFSLASVADRLLVGAPDDDGANAPGGAAYLFGDDFQFLTRFANPTPSLGDSFGQTIALSADRVLIGAPYDDAGAQWAGAAYLFDLQGHLLQTFSNPSPSFDDEFGSAVAFVGNNVVIGARREDAAGSDNGAAYFFSPDGRLLNTLLPPPLPDRPLDTNKQLGSSLTGIGGQISAGAFGVNSVFVFAGGSQLTPLGDADVDGVIGLADFGLLKEHFGMTGSAFDGDFSGNGTIDLADFGLLKENFGKELPRPATAVPEPAGWALAALGALLIGLRRKWAAALLTSLTILLAANGALAVDYMYSPFSIPDATETSVFGINEQGVLSGTFKDAKGVERGFITRGGNSHYVVEYPGAASTVVLGINNLGDVVGGFTDPTGSTLPFYWDGPSTGFHPITLPAGYTGIAAGVNDAGMVVGVATDVNAIDVGFWSSDPKAGTATVEKTPLGPAGTPTVYSDVNESNRIVGEYTDALGRRHGLYGPNVAFDLPLATGTTLAGINDQGWVVGSVSGMVAGKAVEHGFVYADLTYREIAYPGAISTIPSAIANNGTIVGLFEGPGLLRTGFVAIPIDTIQGDLNVDGKVDLADFGIFKENFGKSGAAGVPEPSGWALACLGGGLTLAALRARRPRRQRRE